MKKDNRLYLWAAVPADDFYGNAPVSVENSKELNYVLVWNKVLSVCSSFDDVLSGVAESLSAGKEITFIKFYIGGPKEQESLVTAALFGNSQPRIGVKVVQHLRFFPNV